MKSLLIKFEVHLYSENKLQDDQFEQRKKGYGLYSTDFYNNLFSYIDRKIKFELSDGITIGKTKSIIFNQIFLEFLKNAEEGTRTPMYCYIRT